MFFDDVSVFLSAGNGGDGCMSFRREKYIPHGGPDGGDGGRGGKVILRGSENLSDLTRYKFKPNWQAGNGTKGMGSGKYGKKGADLFLPVPLGTQVFNENSEKLVIEILKNQEEVVLLGGGNGGLGNLHFKSSTNQAPRQFTEGTLGQRGAFRLVLKTIADVGLVGFPNAGKSSLISLITKAHPKTAPYPFTTLQPNVGILTYPTYHDRLQIADIPGLIEGASQNKGLGHRFLKHVERCSLLLFLIDMSGQEGREPLNDYLCLKKELGNYCRAFLKKPSLVVANKMDELNAEENRNKFQRVLGINPLPISCLSEEGIHSLKETLYRKIRNNSPQP